jgi:3-dehydroquinate synthase
LIPTTWLSAIDSAHGGKTGLNVERKKNQLGTFYPASKVLCTWEILSTQGERRFLEARAEALKISWLGAPSKHHSIVDAFSSKEDFFNAIPLMVSEKWKIVRQDPWEKRGIRQRLNLGHTFGHVLEAALGLPHGEAVAWGLKFALNFSWHKKVLSDDGVFEEMTSELDDLLISFRYPAKLSEKEMRTFLLADKKRESSKSIKFVFIKNFGQSLLSPVSIDELIAEAKRQDFCR